MKFEASEVETGIERGNRSAEAAKRRR